MPDFVAWSARFSMLQFIRTGVHRGWAASSSSRAMEKSVEQTDSLRLAPAQSARMDDLGTRNIFTAEQDMFRESGQ